MATEQQTEDLMYLPKDFWSPRYDSTFFTVKIEGFELLTSAPPAAATSDATIIIPSKGTFPAYYYKVVVYREHKRKTLLRRYSQFQWLFRQLIAHPPISPSPPISVSSEEQQHFVNDIATGTPIRQLMPAAVVCRFQWWQDDAFAATRMEDLSDFLTAVLERPGYAGHDAMKAFLELL